MKKFKIIDELLKSDLIITEKLKKLLKLTSLNYDLDKNSKNELVEILLYESVMGLDEILNFLFTEFELRKICENFDKKYQLKFYKKSNLIGIVIMHLPTKKNRKIETVIDEAIDYNLISLPESILIYHLFVMVPDGRSVYIFNFRPLDIGDLTLFGAAVNAVGKLLEELTKMKQIETIELGNENHGELELLFEYGDLEMNYPFHKKLIAILLVNKESEKVRNLLKTFLNKFEERYINYLKPIWDGKISYFYDAKHLVYEIFSDYLEY